MKSNKFKIIHGICVVLIITYSFYSFFTGTGLSGWLIKLQFDLFGVAYDKLTVFLTIAVLMIPLEIARYFLAKKGLNDTVAAEAPPFNGVVWIKSLSVPVLAAVFAAALFPAIGGYGIYSYYYAQNQERLKEKIFDIDLNSNSVKIENERFVRLHGNLQEDLTYTVSKDSRDANGGTQNENYRPVTGENWNETKPIQFIYYSSGYLPPNVATRFKTAPQTVFEGEIIDMTLPVYVRSEYEKMGLKFTEPVYIVHSDFFTDGKIPDRFYNSAVNLYLYGGIIVSVILFFLLLIWKIQPLKKSD